MNLRISIYALSGVALFSLGLITGLTAQSVSDMPNRKEQKRAELSGAANMEVITSISEFKPGESINLHTHHGIEAVYVIQGAMTQTPGNAPSMQPTGFTTMNLRDAKHGEFKVVGDTPLKIFTVHIVDKDKPLYDFVK